MLDQFLQFFKRPDMPGVNCRFGAAVSGGLDSMVLSELCRAAGLDFVVLHCNFQLRGAESERDEQFVRAWGGAHGVEVLVQRFDTTQYAEAHGFSIQEAARELRYKWFRQLKGEGRCDYALLAHHANDSVETALMNYFRGTGLQGLTGIPEKGAYFLRPLLSFTRDEIRTYANQHVIRWVEDSSNRSSKYTRNYFRNELLPAVRTVFPAVEENLMHNIDRFRKTARLYNELVEQLKKKIAQPVTGGIKVPVLQLRKWAHTSLLFELAKDFGFTEKQLPDVSGLLDSASGKYVSSATHRVIRHRNHLVFTTMPPANTAFIAINASDCRVPVSQEFIIEIERLRRDNKPFAPGHLPNRAQLDAGKVTFPLLLRKWRAGDYFYPLGMPKKKKLSRFFIDQKLSIPEKENVWVLESAGRILWVVGMRIDDRFKVTAATAEVISFNVTAP